MTEEPMQPLSAEDLAHLDASYKPFPSFVEWPKSVPREDLWTGDRDKFQAVAQEADDDDVANAREIALRTAAFDTGAIEGLYPTDRGLTFTVATQAATWEQEVLDRDSDALAFFKAQLEAFEMVLDLATSNFPKLTQAWIRQVHEVVTKPQETYVVITPLGPQRQKLPKGEYKHQPNHVKTADGQVHAYAPVDQTPAEMQRLLDELDNEDFKAAHPVTQASYVHYALVAIHPFADGNGRVARAVASAYTYRAASVPLLVLAHHRDLYFAALAKADRGHTSAFVEFISRVGRDALEMVTERLKSAQAPQPEDVLADFREMYVAQGDLSHHQLDEMANQFANEALALLREQIATLSLPDGIEIRLADGTGRGQQPPSGFRSLVNPNSRYIELNLEAAPPGHASLNVPLDVLASTSSDTATSVMLRANFFSEEIVLGLPDLSPQLSSAARLRLESYLRRILGKALQTLLTKSRKRMAKTGY
jgi:Fic family protein